MIIHNNHIEIVARIKWSQTQLMNVTYFYICTKVLLLTAQVAPTNTFNKSEAASRPLPDTHLRLVKNSKDRLNGGKREGPDRVWSGASTTGGANNKNLSFYKKLLDCFKRFCICQQECN